MYKRHIVEFWPWVLNLERTHKDTGQAVLNINRGIKYSTRVSPNQKLVWVENLTDYTKHSTSIGMLLHLSTPELSSTE
jgi:hypothetical protein